MNPISFDKYAFVPTKKSGNYLIYQNGEKRRIQLKLNNVLFPFGKEYYNDSIVFNIKISDTTNYAKNLIFDLLKIKSEFEKLKNADIIAETKDKDFFSFIKHDDIDSSGTTQYYIRAYLKYGAKMSHANFIGQLDKSFDFKNKRANVVIEVGSLWISDATNKYGLNLYITDIVIV